jgi:predicted RNA-binding protein with PUA-like domain
MRDVLLVRKLPLISLSAIREQAALSDLRILQRGNRLSITPVEAAHWNAILSLA